MFEIRCNKTNGEAQAIRALARRIKAGLEVSDEEPEQIWFVLTELPDEPTSAEIEE